MSHYFSQVRLVASPREDKWFRDLARHGESYRDHALIWRLFPGDGIQRDFVFRRLNDDRTYYVVSARKPSLDSGLFQVRSKPYTPSLAAGSLVRLDLRANPTISRRLANGRSQRHDVLMDAKRNAVVDQQKQIAQLLDDAGKDWLLKRAENWGLLIQPESVLQTGYRQQRLRRKGGSIEFSMLDYQGVAQVAEPELLCQALLGGVGHSKGFGCGLLLVRHLG
jgi:CRISPR system Cascade subunit CasE